MTSSYSEETTVYEFSYTKGTGTYQLAGAWSTHLPLSARYPAGEAGLPYYVKDGSSGVGSTYEVGVGDYNVAAKTLTRLRIIASSEPGNAAVNWTGRTRLLIRPLIELMPPVPINGVHFPPPPPPCPTPPTNGQIQIWSAAENAWCPADLCALVAACMGPPPPPLPPPGVAPSIPTFASNTQFQYASTGYLSSTVTTSAPLFYGLGAINKPALVLLALIASRGGGAAPATVGHVSDDFGLVWQRRSAFSGTTTPSGEASNMEIWWADSRSLPQDTPIQVTATYSGTAFGPTIIVAPVIGSVGFAGGSPWDGNPSLPKKIAANDVAPQVGGISTNTDSLLIAWLVTPEAAGGFSGTFLPVAQTSDNGWENLVGIYNAGRLFWLLARNALLAPASKYTAVPFEANISHTPNINPAGLGYLLIVDAIAGG